MRDSLSGLWGLRRRGDCLRLLDGSGQGEAWYESECVRSKARLLKVLVLKEANVKCKGVNGCEKVIVRICGECRDVLNLREGRRQKGSFVALYCRI